MLGNGVRARKEPVVARVIIMSHEDVLHDFMDRVNVDIVELRRVVRAGAVHCCAERSGNLGAIGCRQPADAGLDECANIGRERVPEAMRAERLLGAVRYAVSRLSRMRDDALAQL